VPSTKVVHFCQLFNSLSEKKHFLVNLDFKAFSCFSCFSFSCLSFSCFSFSCFSFSCFSFSCLLVWQIGYGHDLPCKRCQTESVINADAHNLIISNLIVHKSILSNLRCSIKIHNPNSTITIKFYFE
jgi:uncharacterized protein with PQ loop repeat